MAWSAVALGVVFVVLCPVFFSLWLGERNRRKALETRFASVIDVDAERSKVAAEVHQLGEQRKQLESGVQRLTAELAQLQEQEVLLEVGFYKPVYNFSSSDRYQRQLDEIADRQKAMLAAKQAAVCRLEWTVNGSKAEGRKHTDRTLKLMLRAFNGECDAAISKVNYRNITTMETRIRKAAQAISDLEKLQQCFIADEYVKLKILELRLAHEYEEKLQDEKEEQRRIREQQREEERELRELEREKKEADRQEQRYQEALEKARADVQRTQGAAHERLNLKIAELERALAEAQDRQRSISQAQLTKSGHVYVISNIGSFGEHVFKIGMTRRLIPQERIDELGDASVPFEFDVHAIIRTDNAPALENALHHAFDKHRVNRINNRKEFFRASLDEIAAVVRKHHGEFELTRLAEAAQYRKTAALIAEEQRARAVAAEPKTVAA